MVNMTVIYPNHKTLAESWAFWRLEDGSVLKSRIIMQRLRARLASEIDDIEPPNDGDEPGYFLMPDLKVIMSTEMIPTDNLYDGKVPKEDIWKGENYSEDEKEELDVVEVVKTNEGFSYYEVKFGKEIYLLIFSIDGITPRNSEKFDEQGEPIYIVDHQLSFQMFPLTSNKKQSLSIDKSMELGESLELAD